MNRLVPEGALSMLSDLIERKAGQVLTPDRYWRVETMLAPIMRAHALSSVDDLVAALSAGGNRLLERQTIDAMLNHETSFFRDQAAFALLTGPALSSLRESRAADRRIRIWSAACSTGQEAYSVAMSILENRRQWDGWDIEIIGSDVSTSVVEQAREGRYSQLVIQRGMPITLMLRYFMKDGEDWVAKPELRDMVRFRQHNLLDPVEDRNAFDLVLCRNVIMYLLPEHRPRVFRNLARSIRPEGLLMLGAAETIMGQTDLFRSSKDYRGLYRFDADRQHLSAA